MKWFKIHTYFNLEYVYFLKQKIYLHDDFQKNLINVQKNLHNNDHPRIIHKAENKII